MLPRRSTNLPARRRRGRPLAGSQPLDRQIGFRIDRAIEVKIEQRMKPGETRYQAARRVFLQALGVIE